MGIALICSAIVLVSILALPGIAIISLSLIISLAPWLLLAILFVSFITSTTTGNNARFWLGSVKIKFINAVSLVSLITPLMTIAEWSFLPSMLVGCLLTFGLDVVLYRIKPQLFD